MSPTRKDSLVTLDLSGVSRESGWDSLISAYHALEVLTGKLILGLGHKLCGIFALLLEGLDLLCLILLLSVDANVELEEVINGIFLKFLLVTIKLKCKSKKTILLSPVSEVCFIRLTQVPVGLDKGDSRSILTVDTIHIPSRSFVELCKETSNDRGSEMTSVEVLGHIG